VDQLEDTFCNECPTTEDEVEIRTEEDTNNSKEPLNNNSVQVLQQIRETEAGELPLRVGEVKEENFKWNTTLNFKLYPHFQPKIIKIPVFNNSLVLEPVVQFKIDKEEQWVQVSDFQIEEVQ
jgi:hypothetical protein